MTFCTWFLSQLPAFLMSEPVSAFVGLWLLMWTGELVSRMMGLGRR